MNRHEVFSVVFISQMGLELISVLRACHAMWGFPHPVVTY